MILIRSRVLTLLSSVMGNPITELSGDSKVDSWDVSALTCNTPSLAPQQVNNCRA